MKKFFNLAVASLFLVFLSGCMTVAVTPGGGNTVTGIYREDILEIEPWENLFISVPFRVNLYPQDLGTVTISGDSGMLDNITVINDSGTLSIGPSGITIGPLFGPSLPAEPLVITVGSGNLQSVTATSASNVAGQGVFNADSLYLNFSSASRGTFDVSAAELEITASSASIVTVVGYAEDFIGTFNSASTGRFDELTVHNATIDASSASTVRDIYVQNSLDANASSASTVRYRGNPTVRYTATGASNVSGW